ncbi:MAG: hypothetical protein EA402_04055 [Planctomycetota bacterium]|nr:MAG: hypothetical protein EA402_04055 [Planctomycetota bacterium]
MASRRFRVCFAITALAAGLLVWALLAGPGLWADRDHSSRTDNQDAHAALGPQSQQPLTGLDRPGTPSPAAVNEPDGSLSVAAGRDHSSASSEPQQSAAPPIPPLPTLAPRLSDNSDPSTANEGSPGAAPQEDIAVKPGPDIAAIVARRFPAPNLDALAARIAAPQMQNTLQRLRARYPQADLLDRPSLAMIKDDKRGRQALSPEQLRGLGEAYAAIEELRDHLLLLHAQDLGIPFTGIDDGGRGYTLRGFEDGHPVYSMTLNDDAAESTAADRLRRSANFDGSYSSDVDGSGLWVNVNDHGTIYEHPEFFLPDGTSRIVVTQVNDGGSRSHMTHVAGTIAAHGYVERAMGMAPATWIRSLIQQNSSHIYNFGMAYPGQPERSVVGNTSLGSTTSNQGLYTWTSRNLDTWLWDHPWYLHFYSAGNDGGGGFATLSAGSPVAKNVIAVGSVSDVKRNADGNITSGGGLSGFSSRGPTYDGRIKPDIVANGQGLYSPNSASGYGNSSGTSMSSPNAAGSAILLIDYFNKRFPGRYMRAATTRALIINTADDRGNPGPDYRFGWGVMNTLRAAEIIRHYANDPSSRVIIEDALPEGAEHQRAYHSDGGTIRVTLAWHDPPGQTTSSGNRQPNLINNLHLRIIGPEGESHFPFVMPYTEGNDDHDAFAEELYGAHATTGINNRDNVNQVLITNAAAGAYTIEVSHSGSLDQGNAQNYSLAMSGLSASGPSAPSIVSHSPDLGTGGATQAFDIAGSDFLLGAEALLRQGSTDVVALSTIVSNDRIQALMPTADLDVGYYDVVVRNPDGQEALVHNGFLVPHFIPLYQTDFANASGWTLEGQWEVGEPSGVDGNPSTAVIGNQILGYHLAGTYDNNMTALRATSPAISIDDYPYLRLQFERWLGVENGIYDRASIEYQLDNGSWQLLWQNPNTTLIDTRWTPVSYAIENSQLATTLRLRFTMGTTDGSVVYAGWNIDDFQVLGAAVDIDPFAPIITSQPQAQELIVGDPLSLSVGVQAWPAADYQWYRDGVAISGATTATYAVAAADYDDAGIYYVVVDNGVEGPVYSENAEVLVTHGPPSVQITSPTQTLSAIAPGMGLVVEGSIVSQAPPGSPSPEVSWSVISSPEEGAAVFHPPDAINTHITFNQLGVYVLEVTVNDGIHSITRSRSIDVTEAQSVLWQAEDIGSGISTPGSVDASGTTYAVSINSGDIWGSADSFFFLHQALEGDGEVKARVAFNSSPTPHQWAKMGVMIRESLDPGAVYALTQLSHGNGNRFQHRSSSGGSSSSSGSGNRPWVRLQRSGNTFTSSVSDNGEDWIELGSQTLSMPSQALIGLAFSSHNSGGLAGGTFSQVSGFGGLENLGPVVQMPTADILIAEQAQDLPATVDDDGLPNPPAQVVVQWQVVDAPAMPSFDDPTQIATKVSFPEEGWYRLRLRADDGAVITFAEQSYEVVSNHPRQRRVYLQRIADWRWELREHQPLTAEDEGVENPVPFAPLREDLDHHFSPVPPGSDN